jgi:hypothetical protein
VVHQAWCKAESSEREKWDAERAHAIPANLSSANPLRGAQSQDRQARQQTREEQELRLSAEWNA